MPNNKTKASSSKNSSSSSSNETFEKDQDDLMTTLESIKGLLEQSESKLNAARESISIANTNTINDTSALSTMRGEDEEEIVPILDEIVEPDFVLDSQSDSISDIPELDSIIDLETPEFEENITTNAPNEIKEPQSSLDITTDIPEKNSNNNIESAANNKDDLAALTQKNLLIDALDKLQLDLELSLREDLMKTMVSLEKNLKESIALKVESIKKEILK